MLTHQGGECAAELGRTQIERQHIASVHSVLNAPTTSLLIHGVADGGDAILQLRDREDGNGYRIDLFTDSARIDDHRRIGDRVP